MKKIQYLFALLGLLLLASCLPEADSNGNLLHGMGTSNTNTGTGGTTVTKYLSKVTTKDDYGNPYIVNYNYTSGKLTSITTSNDSISYNITYGTDNLISKVTRKEKDDSGQIVTTNLSLAYNTSKVLTKLSGQMESGGIVLYYNDTTYSYNSDGKVSNVKTTLFNYDPANPTTPVIAFTLESVLKYSGNNVSSWNFTDTPKSTPPIIVPPIIFNIVASNYDNYKSPYSTLPYVFNLISIHEETETNSILGLSSNNGKNFNITTNAGLQPFTASYTYDSDGYANSLTIGTDVYKFEYIKP